MKKGLFYILALIIVIGALTGCASSQPPEDQAEVPQHEEPQYTGDLLEIVDDFGNEIKLDQPAERIISLAPSNTEILFAIGAGEKVIGVTTYDDYPEEALAIEKIGDFNGINIERIIELEPDLVINYGDGITEENQRLIEAGIPIAGFEPESIEEITDVIIRIGVLTGNAEEASALAEDMIDRKNEIIEKLKDVDQKKVFYEVWHEPLMAAGPGSFVDELIILAGGENIAADADSEYPQFDLEQLIERNPQVYITANDLPEKTIESIKERPGYAEIDAVKEDQLYLVDGNIMSRPGPRIIQALELIVESIHPGILD